MRKIAVVLLLPLLASCQDAGKFEMHVAPNGTPYRLNKMNGNVSVVDGPLVVPLEEAPKNMTPTALRKQLAEVKSWPDLTLPFDNVKITLRTNWRDGSMYYIFVAAPLSQKLIDAKNKTDKPYSFTLALRDKNGFQIAQIAVPFRDMNYANDKKGKPAGLAANAKMTLGMDLYQAVSSWSATWVL